MPTLDELFASPSITVSGTATALSLTDPVAQKIVNELTEAGILREMTGRATNRVYLADEIFNQFDEPTADAEKRPGGTTYGFLVAQNSAQLSSRPPN